MARLRDVPVVLRRIGPVELGRRVYNEVCLDHLFLFSAAVAYAWLFAVFPFCVFLANLAPLFLDQRPAVREAQVRQFLEITLPLPAANAMLQEPIVQAVKRSQPAWLSLSLLVALWAASNGMNVTMAVLDKCYELDQIRAYHKRRPMAFFLTLACTALVLCVLVLLPVGRVFRDWYLRDRPAAAGVEYDWVLKAFDAARVTLGVALLFVILALIYHFGPSVKHRWRWVTPGAVFTVAMWVLLHLGFKLYVALYAAEGYGQTYGNVAGIAILLALFYVDALILLTGAEINAEVDFEMLRVKRGSRDFRTAERKVREAERRMREGGPAAAELGAATVADPAQAAPAAPSDATATAPPGK